MVWALPSESKTGTGNCLVHDFCSPTLNGTTVGMAELESRLTWVSILVVACGAMSDGSICSGTMAPARILPFTSAG